MTKPTLSKARAELERIGIITHFVGEFALAGLLGACALKTRGGDPNFVSHLAQYTGIGTFIYGACQALAVHLEGVAVTPERLRKQAIKDWEDEKKCKERGDFIGRSTCEQFARTREHYADNHERYMPQLNFYAKMRGVENGN